MKLSERERAVNGLQITLIAKAYHVLAKADLDPTLQCEFLDVGKVVTKGRATAMSVAWPFETAVSVSVTKLTLDIWPHGVVIYEGQDFRNYAWEDRIDLFSFESEADYADCVMKVLEQRLLSSPNPSP